MVLIEHLSHLEKTVPDVPLAHVVAVVEDGHLLQTGDQREPLVIVGFLLPWR